MSWSTGRGMGWAGVVGRGGGRPAFPHVAPKDGIVFFLQLALLFVWRRRAAGMELGGVMWAARVAGAT